jgi:protein gp37
MATAISWTEETWNPTLGCTKVSPGCDGCYAIRQARIRAANPHPKIAAAFDGIVERTASGLDWTGRVNQLPDRLDLPLRWRKPRRVFVDSMSDLFHDEVSDEFIARVFAVMAAAPQHTFQLLTKRHGRMRSLLSRREFWESVCDGLVDLDLHPDGRDTIIDRVWPRPAIRPLHNVWLGVSVEDQQRADLRIPALLKTPAAVRWISAEPLLGPVGLDRIPYRGDVEYVLDVLRHEYGQVKPRMPFGMGLSGLGGIDWVVTGGESGPAARPMDPAWARSLRDQCTAAGVPFHHKQNGEWAEAGFGYGRLNPGELYVGDPVDDRGFRRLLKRVGVKAAGRELDGHVHDEYPNDKSGATP